MKNFDPNSLVIDCLIDWKTKYLFDQMMDVLLIGFLFRFFSWNEYGKNSTESTSTDMKTITEKCTPIERALLSFLILGWIHMHEKSALSSNTFLTQFVLSLKFVQILAFPYFKKNFFLEKLVRIFNIFEKFSNENSAIVQTHSFLSMLRKKE